MDTLKDLERKILLKMFEMDPDGRQALILKENLASHFPDYQTEVLNFLERLENEGLIKTPNRSFSFHFTNKGQDYCRQFFI